MLVLFYLRSCACLYGYVRHRFPWALVASMQEVLSYNRYATQRWSRCQTSSALAAAVSKGDWCLWWRWNYKLASSMYRSATEQKCLNRSGGRTEVTKRVMTILLCHSTCPFVCNWYANVDKCFVRCAHRLEKNLLIISVLLSVSMYNRMKLGMIQAERKTFATLVVVIFGVGIARVSSENLSVTITT